MVRPIWRAIKVAVYLLGMALAYALTVLLLTPLSSGDPYGFLNGRRPAFVGMRPAMNVLTRSGCRYNPPSEYRVYSWKQSASEVMDAALRELKSLGFRETRGYVQDGWLSFVNSRESISIALRAGRSRTRRQAWAGDPKPDPTWVTVLIQSDAPQNWLTNIRLALESDIY